MERLTIRNSDGSVSQPTSTTIQAVFEKLTAYEDLEEQGRLVVLPCKVRGVVHCKDCKWCHAGYCEKYDDLIPFGCANKPWEDWFCADGKRREAKKEAQDAD